MEKQEKIKNLLTRSVDRIYPSEEALEKTMSSYGRKLRVYLGVDPTGPHLHLGHMTNLLVLKRLQDLGHEIIFLIGDLTARIGDPTDKLSSRQPLTESQIKENLKTFKKQASRIIRFSGANSASLKFNYAWHKKLTEVDFMKILELVTHQHLVERDMFQDRIKAGRAIHMNEFVYPLLQGYDSVAMDVDLEIGGTDQTFNMLMGRHLMRALKNKEKFVLATRLLVNPKTGVKLMNKSEGGLINLDDSPENIFGKVMALDDYSIFPVAELCTEMDMDQIHELKKSTESRKLNPRDAKAEIAEEVVKTIYGGEKARKARLGFEKIFSKKEAPANLPKLKLETKNPSAIELVLASGVAKSRSEARRLIEQGGVEIDGVVKKGPGEILFLRGGEVVRMGKHQFFRVK